MAARRKPSAQHNPPRRPESDPTRVLRSEIRDRPRRERTVAAPLLHRVSSNLSEDARRALLAMGTTDVVAASTPRNPPPPRPNRGDEAVPDATTAQAARRAANLRKMHRAGKNRPDPAPEKSQQRSAAERAPESRKELRTARPSSLLRDPRALLREVRSMSLVDRAALRAQILAELRGVRYGKYPGTSLDDARERARVLIVVIDREVLSSTLPKRSVTPSVRTKSKKSPSDSSYSGASANRTTERGGKFRSVRTYSPTPTFIYPVRGRTVSGGLPSLGKNH